jgi:hypothetical protein
VRPTRWFLAAGLCTIAPPMAAQNAAADSSYLALVHQLVRNLDGAGHRADEVYYVNDSVALRQLQASSIAVTFTTFPSQVGCPSPGLTPSTTSPVGYATSIEEERGMDSLDRTIAISVSCSYVRRDGLDFGFMQSGKWALHRDGNVWSVVKQLSGFIT